MDINLLMENLKELLIEKIIQKIFWQSKRQTAV
jgi:hypothetical protein